MSFTLVPTFRSNDWWPTYDYPSRIRNQFFGDVLENSDLLVPSFYRGFTVRPRIQEHYLNSSGKSEIAIDDKLFKVSLNVSQFKPEELEVKIVDNSVVVHGKHEEKRDEHGFIAREFTRKYMLPSGCAQENISCTLTSDSMLIIQAPRVVPPETPKEERQVPISREESSAVEDKK